MSVRAKIPPSAAAACSSVRGVMDAIEAADVIEAISNSLRSNPGQFRISINVTGQRITSLGGTALSISARGGGPGSTTIGQSLSVGAVGDIEIAQERGAHAFNEQYNVLVASLAELSQQLRSVSPDRSRVRQLLESLKGTWVPGVITSIVATVISKALGL